MSMFYFKLNRLIILLLYPPLMYGCSQLPVNSLVKPLKLYGMNEDAVQNKGTWIAGIRPTKGGVYVDIAVLVSDDELCDLVTNRAAVASFSDTKCMCVQIRTESNRKIRLFPTRERVVWDRGYYAPNIPNRYLTKREGEPDLLIQNLSFRCSPKLRNGVYEARLTKDWIDWCKSNLGITADENWRTFVID